MESGFLLPVNFGGKGIKALLMSACASITHATHGAAAIFDDLTLINGHTEFAIHQISIHPAR